MQNRFDVKKALQELGSLSFSSILLNMVIKSMLNENVVKTLAPFLHMFQSAHLLIQPQNVCTFSVTITEV